MTFMKFSYHTASCLYIPFFLKNKIITLEQRTALYMTTIHSPSPPVRPCVQGSVECSFLSRMYPLPAMALHLLKQLFSQVQCRRCCHCLVTKSCVTFATPWTEACQASLSFTISQSFLKFMSIELVMPSNHLIPCCPLLLLPSLIPSKLFLITDFMCVCKFC